MEDLRHEHNKKERIRLRQPRIVKVSLRHKHRLCNNKFNYSLKRTLRPSRIIHVIINSSKATRLKDNNTVSNQSSTKQTQQQNSESNKPPSNQSIVTCSKTSIIRSVGASKIHRSHYFTPKKSNTSPKHDRQYIRGTVSTSSRVSPYQDTKDDSSDQAGMTRDYHRTLEKNQTKKCSRKCIIISVLIALLGIIIILAVSLALLIKPNTTTILTVMPTLRWNTTGITIAGTGIAGNGSDQFNGPTDVVLEYPNLLYVTDYNNNRVQKFVVGTLNAVTVAGDVNGTGGVLANRLRQPTRVLIESTSSILVADCYNNRIQRFYNGASNGTTIAGDASGSMGTASNRLNLPYGIAQDLSSGALYVADYGNHRIMYYSSGALSGTLVAGNQTAGTSSTQLNYPVRVYFESLSNSLVITNHVSNNIVRWTLGATNWTLLAGDINGLSGNSSSQFNHPTEVIFDPMGNMYVADRDNHRIQLFLINQSKGITIAGVTGIFGANASLLRQPWSIRLDNQLNLYVADFNNHRIQKFLRY